MTTIFEKMILGHLVGDYMIQSKKMALLKSNKDLNGLMWCISHCFLYTLSISIFTQTTDPIKIFLIFMSHFPIDHWSLASKWLKFIKGRDFISAYKSTSEFREIDLAFSTIVYVAVDNTMHILLMWFIFN
ncbi:MAG: DUF3307 domain-containing protein [Candidatus Falkowbacteria bacterium]